MRSSTGGRDDLRRFPGSKPHEATDNPAREGMEGSSLGTFTRSQDCISLGTFPWLPACRDTATVQASTSQEHKESTLTPSLELMQH